MRHSPIVAALEAVGATSIITTQTTNSAGRKSPQSQTYKGGSPFRHSYFFTLLNSLWSKLFLFMDPYPIASIRQ